MDDDRYNLFVVASMNNDAARSGSKQSCNADIDARLTQINRAS